MVGFWFERPLQRDLKKGGAEIFWCKTLLEKKLLVQKASCVESGAVQVQDFWCKKSLVYAQTCI